MTTTEHPELTCGQLERRLAQHIQALYRNQLGHRPGQITCQILDSKVMIVIENSITLAEQLLVQEGQDALVEQVRSELDEAIQSQLKALMEEVLQVTILDILSDATLETERTGIIVILAETPRMRESRSSRKVKANC